MAERLAPFPPRTVVLDADSTLAGIEGIDWLAERRPAAVATRIAELTSAAMAGSLPLDQVYAERLAAVAPGRAELDALGDAYIAAVAPGAVECVSALIGAGIRPLIVSGGLRPALLPLAAHLGIPASDVHGVGLRFAADGGYADYDAALLETGGLGRPLVAVGDGSTDLVIRTAGVADAFIAYTGFVARDAVVRGADFECHTYEGLRALLLPSS